DSDSPTLPMAFVAEAADLLGRRQCDVVLGPCEDGGYYLIGVRSPQPALFDGIVWSTATVFDTTLAKAKERHLSVHVLPNWFDVDTESDLTRLTVEIATANDGPPRTTAFLRRLESLSSGSSRRETGKFPL